jgi:hypothetical protein
MHVCRSLTVLLGSAFLLAAQVPDFTPPTPLMRALLRYDNEELDRLLASGANPNEGKFIGRPPILVGLLLHNDHAVQSLIAKGADVKATDAAGSTTLMWAATSETGDTKLVDKLLQLGVDPNASNKSGETALGWALRRGHTPVVECLRAHGASDTAIIRESVEKSIALLQKSGAEFIKVSGCSSCHHQSLPQMAFAEAREHGFAVDPQMAQQQTKAVVAMFKPMREQMMQGKENVPDPAISVSYSLIGLAAEAYAPDPTTEAMAHLVSTQQGADGSFRTLPGRPPIESSVISATALSLRALQLYGENPEQAVLRARNWLLSASPATTEERVMQLLGLAWAKTPEQDLRIPARALLAQQRPDGGWAQLPSLDSDAYATGQALVALHASGQLRPADRAYQQAVAFLLRTQRPDGSWLVRTRSVPFQPYKESGFPHGKDQWISAAGTSWAVMALSATTPKPAEQLSQAF